MARSLLSLLMFFPSCSNQFNSLSLLLFSLFFPPSRLCLLKMLARRNVCFQGGGVLSVVVGFIPIRGSNNGKRPVAERTVARSRNGNPTSNGGPRTWITSEVPICGKKQNTERALTTCASIASSIPPMLRRNAAYVRKWRQKLRQAPVSCTSSDPPLNYGAEKPSDVVS